MDHVAALAKGGKLVKGAIARVVVEVRTGQHHRCPPALDQDILGWPSYPSAAAVAPVPPAFVPPASVTKVKDLLSMRTPTMLASPTCPHKPNKVRELWPVNWVQEDVLRADGHEAQIRSALVGALGLIAATMTQRVRDRA